MHNTEVALCESELFYGEDIAVLESDIVLLVKEALALYAGHIEYIELRKAVLKRGSLHVLDALAVEDFTFYVIGSLWERTMFRISRDIQKW